jgi:hypothetical protein
VPGDPHGHHTFDGRLRLFGPVRDSWQLIVSGDQITL